MVLLALIASLHMASSDDSTRTARDAMVDLIAKRGVKNEAVLRAMRRFPRHELVPSKHRDQAYYDKPLPIGYGQTISQPYMVAVMSEVAQVRKGDKVLEVGTGSGYQAAILAEMGVRVFSIEIVPELAERAGKDLERLGIKNVTIRHGDGYLGWPDQAPFDAIIVTAAPETVPPPLIEQLREGGRLVIPVGPTSEQVLEVHIKTGGKVTVREKFPVRFVPMTGKAQAQ